MRYLMCIFCAVNVSQGNGGALALLGVHAHSYVATSTFENCTSALSGGAMWVSHFVTYPSNPLLSTIKIESCTFEGNAATKGGAFTVATESSVTIQSSQFKNNTASQEGGALDVDTESSVTVQDSLFTDNTATGSGRGGAIMMAVNAGKEGEPAQAARKSDFRAS